MKNIVIPSFKTPIFLILLVLSSYSVAIQPISEAELRESAEKLSVNNSGGFDAESLFYLQRDNEQNTNSSSPKNAAPNLFTPRDNNLIKGDLTPDRVRQDNMTESLRSFRVY